MYNTGSMKLNSANSSPYLFLNDSDLLFKMVFNQQFYFVARLSPVGRVLEVNDLAIASHGASREDYVGKLLWQSPAWLNFPEWEHIWQQRLAEASTAQDPVITEDIFQIKDGSIHYSDVSTAAVYDPHNGQLSGYIIQVIDTTKRRLKEEQMQVSKARLEFVLEQSHIGHWELNLVDHTSYRSLIHDQIFGYDSLLSEWTYEMFIDHVVPEERANVEQRFQQAIKNEKDWHIECKIMRKDGEICWILASGGHAFDIAGQAKLMVGIVLDITDLKQAEINKLQHSAELKSIFNALPDTYFRMMPDGTILDFRAQNKDDLYKNPEDFIGQRMQDVLPIDIGELFQENINEVALANDIITFKYQLRVSNQLCHFEARLNKIPHNDQIICAVRNVTEEYESKKSLAASEELFRTIFDQAAIGVALISANTGGFIRINQRFCNMLGYNAEELTSGTDFEAITHPDDLKISLSNREKIQSGQQQSTTIEKRYIHKSGIIVWVELTATSTWKVGEHPQTVIVVAQDISQRKKTEETLQLSARIVRETREGIMITDAEQLIIDVNPAFIQITGYSAEDVIGKSPNILNSGKQSLLFYEEMWQSIKELGHWQGEVWNRTKAGELYAELLNISSLSDENDRVTHYISVFSDITSIKQQQEQFNLMAHYDVLTKLPNRALFVDRFHQSIAHSIRTGHQLAVCFLDLDDFKPVNDTYGHEAGDRLLIEVAARITSCIREEDTVSRQGGDEFAILLNDIKLAPQYEDTLKRIHQALAQPYFIDDVQHHITASSGVTLYPSDNGDIDTLLRHADHAMYQSKLAGKNRTQLYSPDLDQRIIQKNLQLGEIELALINNQFQLYYQPKVNMATGEVFGAEALIRWLHPEKGLIPPLDFLPFIDGTSLESKVGEWVISEALQQLDDWQQQGIKLEVSVNISSNHLISPDFFTALEKCLADYPSIDAKYLQLEILESSSLGDLKTITQIITTCQNRLGVSFALDDFGTGYSSLTHLRSLPAETIKIDQSFVRDMLDDPSDYSIIDAVISLTKSFNRLVIAEGVETSNHGLMLLLMGCEKAQGYGIAKPMPGTMLCQWLSNYSPNKSWLICGNEQRNYKETSVEIFKLITEQWKDKLSRMVLSSPDAGETWPMLDSKLCHCGNWIKQTEQEQLFEQADMQKLEQAHLKVHVIALAMQHKYQAGNIAAARADLVSVDLAFNVMKDSIELLTT